MDTRKPSAEIGGSFVPRRARLTLGLVLAALVGVSLLAVRVSAQAFPARASSAHLDVLPFPGTPDAPAQTQIHFPALSPAELRSISVAGSRSGVHRGRLEPVAAHGGTAFLPYLPFAGGEQVSVHATLSSPAAGTASGAPQATQISFSFTVAVPVPAPAPLAVKGTSVAHDIRETRTGTHSFQSEPGLHPPIVWRSGRPVDPSAGDIFADVENSIEAGPMILDPSGRLVWFEAMHHSAAFNVEVQEYQGQSVLTFWQGYVQNNYGIGIDLVLNHAYQQVATIRAAEGLNADLHEFQITPEGNALITAYQPVHADLRSVGGPRNGTLLDSVIEEINIATGELVWEWHAYGHVPITDSFLGWTAGKPYDFFHVNSIQQLSNRDLLVSGRDTSAIYEINPRSGKVVWTVGGRHSSFKIGQGANFEWQHDAHMQGNHTLTVFDDAAIAGHQSEVHSRALRIRLDYKARSAVLVRDYTNSPPVLVGSQGSVQALPNGNTFVGWGEAPYFTEFGRSGGELFSLHYRLSMSSYRAYRFQWRGQPAAPPSIAALRSSNGTKVYASWNGATDVSTWRVLAGSSPTKLTEVGQSRRTAFETPIWTSSTKSYFSVQAVDQRGKVLATSPAVRR